MAQMVHHGTNGAPCQLAHQLVCHWFVPVPRRSHVSGVAYLHIASSPDAWRDVVVYTEPERRLAKCQYYFIGMNDGNKRDGFSKDQ